MILIITLPSFILFFLCKLLNHFLGELLDITIPPSHLLVRYLFFETTHQILNFEFFPLCIIQLVHLPQFCYQSKSCLIYWILFDQA